MTGLSGRRNSPPCPRCGALSDVFAPHAFRPHLAQIPCWRHLVVEAQFLGAWSGTVDDFVVRKSLAIPPDSTGFRNRMNSLAFRHARKPTKPRNEGNLSSKPDP